MQPFKKAQKEAEEKQKELELKQKEAQQKQKEPKIRSLKVYVHYTYALDIHYSSSNITLFYGHLKGAIHMSKFSFQIYICCFSF